MWKYGAQPVGILPPVILIYFKFWLYNSTIGGVDGGCYIPEGKTQNFSEMLQYNNFTSINQLRKHAYMATNQKNQTNRRVT
jgi:hypothetical protein